MIKELNLSKFLCQSCLHYITNDINLIYTHFFSWRVLNPFITPTPSEGRQRWHYDTLSSPHLPPPALVLSDDCGPPGAVGAWAPPPHPPEPRDLPRDYGPDGAAGGLKPEYPAASGPRDYGRGPTTGTRSQTTCYVRRGTGRVVHCTIYYAVLFIVGQLVEARDHTKFESALLNDIFLRKWRYALIGNKRKRWPRPLISAIIHIPCAVYSCSLVAVERRSEGATQAYILYGQKGLVALEFRATKSFARTF